MAKFCKQTRDDHVQDKCWVFLSIGGRHYEINDIFLPNACVYAQPIPAGARKACA